MGQVPKRLSALSDSSDPGEEYAALPDGYQIGRTKHIIVTGSVMSGLGKGIFSAGLAHILEDTGLNTNLIKMDGYFNEDAGTLSPYRHGEVFVLDDGTECDMDVGTYERFVNRDFSQYNIFTNGRLSRRINELERGGRFSGSDVQFYPHVIGEIIRFVRESGMSHTADVNLVEIGGTVGDEENRPYLSAMSDLAFREGENNVFFINLVWIIEASHLREQKSKAAQHGTQLLMQLGIKPHMLVCRAENRVQDAVKKKLAERMRLPAQNIIDLRNLESVYDVPAHLRGQNIHRIVLDYFGIADRVTKENPLWTQYVWNYHRPQGEVRIGLAGKYLGPRDTYASIHNALEHAATHLNVKVEVVDVAADKMEHETGDTEIKVLAERKVASLDGILVPGGFGRRGMEGKIACIHAARTTGLPFLGICFGFQAAMIEFARSCCDLKQAQTTEIDPDTPVPIICLLPEQYEIEGIGASMRLGKREIQLRAGSLATCIYGSDKAHERFRHRYEFNPEYRQVVEQNGMLFSGWAPGQPIMQIAELPDHPFYFGVQFHPEFTSRPVRPNPAFYRFVEACKKHSRR